MKKKSAETPENYQTAFQELQQIIAEMQSENANIDQLIEQTSRAKTLIQFCRQRLRTAEEEVAKLVEG